jgi:hypothetical protein
MRDAAWLSTAACLSKRTVVEAVRIRPELLFSYFDWSGDFLLGGIKW